MAGAIDIHSHIASGNVNNARMLSPEIHANFMENNLVFERIRSDTVTIDTNDFMGQIRWEFQAFEVEVAVDIYKMTAAKISFFIDYNPYFFILINIRAISIQSNYNVNCLNNLKA